MQSSQSVQSFAALQVSISALTRVAVSARVVCVVPAEQACSCRAVAERSRPGSGWSPQQLAGMRVSQTIGSAAQAHVCGGCGNRLSSPGRWPSSRLGRARDAVRVRRRATQAGAGGLAQERGGHPGGDLFFSACGGTCAQLAERATRPGSRKSRGPCTVKKCQGRKQGSVHVPKCLRWPMPHTPGRSAVWPFDRIVL